MRPSRFLALVLLTGLGACSQLRPNPTAPNYMGGTQARMTGTAGGGGNLLSALFGHSHGKGGGGGAGVGVNAYLWRGALDILSFMPLASEDPFGGVIMTDWYQPTPSANERFRATAYILGRQMRADAIRVTLFRQVQQNGQWVDAPVSKITVGELESKVLARARELRTHDLAHGATESY